MVLLEMRRIVKRFPGVLALDGVDFELERGEIHALLGENGAGKSTLIKVLAGVHRPDRGLVRLEGREIAVGSPAAAQRLGVSTVFQEIDLIPTLSIAENVCLGREPTRLGRIDRRAIRERARAALDRLGLRLEVDEPLEFVPLAVQQLTAIARALDVSARVLVLDEPTSSLDETETERLFAVLRALRGEGLGIVFVTHFLDQVEALADRLTVLRNGRLVGTHATADVSRRELVSLMLGRELEEVARELSPAASPRAAEAAPLVELRRAGRRGSVQAIDLSVRAGEVVGLAGLLGSGRTELARLLFGLDRLHSGELRVEGRPVVLRGPREAIALGVALAPEDRRAQALVPELSVRENVVLALQARRGALRPLSPARQREIADRFIRSLGIATPDAETPVRLLSGGNQQKAVLARWLACEPRLLILDDPTRGIDVGAKAEIERWIAELSADGMAVVFSSSEPEEVARVAHRIAVLRDRRKVAELAGEEAELSRLLHVMASDA